MQRLSGLSLVGLLVAGQLACSATSRGQDGPRTATPIKHVVVIFGENISFDHYFGTYPKALNPKGEPRFVTTSETPAINGFTEALLKRNPNFLNTSTNGSGAKNPFRLARTQASTADQDHSYTPEQRAFHAGLMDSFPQYTGAPGPPPNDAKSKGLVMGYYDGNTVTALWNYAQRYAMNDNSFGTTFGPSTIGAINLISGQTNGVSDEINARGDLISGGNGTSTLIDDVNPIGDVCSATLGAQVHFTGKNIGDLLNVRGVTWGWFEGGFDLSLKNPNGTTGCARSTRSRVTKVRITDYLPHHEPFQYYTATSNLKHVRPSSTQTIGHAGDAANHQYDIHDFYAAVRGGNMPAVSFLKAPGYQDAHAGYSDPLDEQTFIVTVINFLEQEPQWSSTAVIIAYDDSDGWYDHQMGPIVNQSTTAADMLSGIGQCGDGRTSLAGPHTPHAQGRCGYGPRLPLLVLSPYARRNFVDHALTDQTSIIRFVEDNWLGGQRVGDGSFDAIAGSLEGMFNFSKPANSGLYLLNPSTGEIVTDHD
ncbi:MAG: alkaline phosphatase family protein [Acidobacteriaceae bacterium]